MGILKAIKSVSWGYLYVAVILAGAGLALIAYPEKSAQAIGIITGAATAIFGLTHLVRTLSRTERGFRFAVSIIFSALAIACGVAFAITAEKSFGVLTQIFGLFLVIDGSFKLQTVVRSHREKQFFFWLLLVVAILVIGGGFLCIRFSDSMIADGELKKLSYLFGATLMIDGLSNLLSLFYIDILRFKENRRIHSELDAAVSRAREEAMTEALKNASLTEKPPVAECAEAAPSAEKQEKSNSEASLSGAVSADVDSET